jgi:hypothetical protein
VGNEILAIYAYEAEKELAGVPTNTVSESLFFVFFCISFKIDRPIRPVGGNGGKEQP